jgi:hypothetical protein
LLVESRVYLDMGLGALAVQAVQAADAARPELRTPVLTLAAYEVWNQGRVERARSFARLALRDGIISTIVNPYAPHQAAAAFELSAGNHARAREIGDEARAALNTIDNPYAQTAFFGSIATFEGMAGRIEDARADAGRAVQLARQSGNRYLLAGAYHGTAWALQRDDPAAALAAAEKSLAFYREIDIAAAHAPGVNSLTGGLRARLGDDAGALELLHEAVIVGRDQGVRPQLAAALDWALSPLSRTGQADVAATFIGGLTGGALAGVGNFPGVDTARARTLERIRTVLGDEKTDELVAHGAAMSYDELVEYAIHHLARPHTNSDS